MLYLYYDKKKIAKHLVTNIDKAFDKREDMWFYDSFTSDIVKRVDCVELLPPRKIASPVFGESDVTFLSKYAKIMIMLNSLPNAVYKISDIHPEMGDVLQDLSSKKDLHVLVDSYFEYDEDQQAVLPEFSVTLKGASVLKSTYSNIIRKKGATSV